MSDENTTRLAACHCLELVANDARFPIFVDEEVGEYQFRLVPAGIAVIYFCPWCGKPTPESKRKSFFTDPTPADISSAESNMAEIKNESDMRRILGEPDTTILAKGPSTRTQYTYSARWTSLTLYIHVRSDGELEMAIAATPLAKTK